MRETVEILASAIHDAKNQLFFAESQVAALAAENGLDASVAQNAIELASERLTNALLAYRIARGEMQPSVSAVAVSDLVEDVRSIHHANLEQQHIAFEVTCDVQTIWPIDRDLIIDILNNAIQNAARHTRSGIALSARTEDGWLVLRVEDDGPGFSAVAATIHAAGSGIGLDIGRSIAALHRRHERQGELRTFNGGSLGGGVVELRLP